MKKWLLVLAAIAMVGGLAWYFFARKDNAPPPNSTTQNSPGQPAGFDKAKYSLTAPDSIWVIVNKKNRLPEGYEPNDLVTPDVKLRLGPKEEQMHLSQRAQSDLVKMFAAAAKDKVILVFGSGYRSEILQRQFYNNYVSKDGRAAADTYSARPGHSEHQTGLAFDATSASQKCHLEKCFADLAEGKWLAAHAHEHGFLLRYYKDKQDITGYIYEPWHFRFVGKELAGEVYRSGLTLEEFFNLPPAGSY